MSATDQDDLWPADIASPPEQKAPLVILREQAAHLAKKTKNLVEAEVAAMPDPTEEGTLYVRFTLVAPVLSNYRYHLFSAVQGASMYPVKLHFEQKFYRAETEDILKEELRKIFSSEKVKQIISSLVAQSQS